jgi:hypothetical protein
MKMLLTLFLLSLALISALRAVSAASTERLLWGLLASSIGLGLAVQLRSGGYYGLLMVAVFVLTDLMIYLFFRSLKLAPSRPARSERNDRLFRIFFLWVSFCAIAGSLLFVFKQNSQEAWVSSQTSGMALLANRLWAGDWLLACLPVLGLAVLVTGGFFLVRRER